jgi:acyl-CoA thioesterase-2
VVSPGQRLVDVLVRRLDLASTGADRFRGIPGRGEGRVFGGMLLAQGVIAAGRTVTASVPHAIHAQFVRPGRYGVEIDWSVERVRDGRQFATRRVDGRQADRLVITLTASFARPGEGLAHQDAMPAAPAPDGLPDWEDLRVAILKDAGARRPDGPLEIRECDPASAVPAPGRPARRALWMRLRGTLPNDPLVHAAALVFASDRGLLSTAARPHGLMWGARQGASLDHAVWLHGSVRFDGWTLYRSESPVAVGGRALLFGAMWSAGGVRIASVAQEGIIRLGAPPPGPFAAPRPSR